MDLTLGKTTLIGLGHATLADAFQCGREAAQMAKSQLPEGNLDLVLVFGPGNVHFQDFIEGVRLVTGEETLVGIPVQRVFSAEKTSPDSCFVLIFQSVSMKFSIAFDAINAPDVLKGTTTLITKFRQLRGNEFQNFAYQGLLLFENSMEEVKTLALQMGADIGLENWMVGAAPSASKMNGLICQSVALRSGLIGIECLSQHPWGVGTVDLGAFPDHPDVYQQAVKSATREALAHLKDHPPALGLIFFDVADNLEDGHFQNLLDGAQSVLPNVPILGIPTKHHFARSLHRSMKIQSDSIVSVLVPA